MSDFSAGKLSAESIDEIAEHLETCLACQSSLETVAEQDELMAALEAPAEADKYSAEAACACFVKQLASASRTDCETRLSASHLMAGAKSTAATWKGNDASPQEQVCDVRFGQYVLLRQIGRGGMGTVYQALHTHLERIVAIKMLTSDRMKDADAVARFEREMRAVGRLEHPQIVRAMDAGQHDGVHFLVMEYVHGPDVSAVVSGIGPLPVAAACEIARQVAVGLEYAFRRGLVHRDIKPSNLMLDVGEDVATFARTWASAEHPHVLANVAPPGGDDSPNSAPTCVRVLDFGLALLEDNRGVAVEGLSSAMDDTELTDAGQLMGTLDYIAPEQVGSSHDVDVRADIYSLGATLFKLLTGVAPFATEDVVNPAKRMQAIRNSDARLASSLRPDLPAELVAIVARMLSRDPAARFQTPAEVAAALTPFASGTELKQLALRVWNPESTLVTIRELPSILAKQRELQDATLPHLLPSVDRTPNEPTTDRLGHDETGTNFPRDADSCRRARESSDEDRETSQTEKLSNRNLVTSAIRAARWVASVVVLVVLAAFAITKWRESVDDGSSMTNALPKREPPVPITAPFAAAAAAASQQAWAEELGVPVEFENSIGMRFRVIPPGKFTAGLTPEEVEAYQGSFREGHMADLFASSAKQREVTLSKPFAVGVTEVTVEQFARFVDATGHVPKGDGSANENSQWRKLLSAKNWSRLPIASINWHDAVAFADWLSKKENATYSLPTEAEWEFACRAGRRESFPESKPEDRQDGDDELTLNDVAWAQMPKVSPQPVGQKRPNAFGLHDMLGNVAEWCQDNFVMIVDSEPTTDPVGPPFSDQRVMRGGTLANAIVFVRSGFRNGGRPAHMFHDWGFRLVRRFDDSADSRGKFLRPTRELDELPTPLGENAVEVGMFGQVDVPNLNVDVTKPITMELFVTPRWTEFRETRHVAGSFSQFSLFVTPDERGSGWSLGLMHKDRYQGLIAPVRLEAGHRTHVAGVRDGKVARVFVDGKLVMQQEEFPSPLRDSPTPFSLGGLMATIDEARLSDVARYDAEFTPQTRFEPDEHTVGLWHLDEGTGTQATDSSGRGHHAVLSGARWTREAPADSGEVNPQDTPVNTAMEVVVEPAAANENNALLFRDRGIVVVNSLKPTLTSELTIECFATPTDDRSGDWQFLVGWPGQPRLLKLPSGNFAFALQTADGKHVYADGPLGKVGERLHLAGVLDGSTTRLYVNGELVSEKSLAAELFMDVRRLLTIGSRGDGSYQFPGLIDEIRVSNTARYRENFSPAERLDADGQTLALFHCDEVRGDTLVDSSSHEHHGELRGAILVRAGSLKARTPRDVLDAEPVDNNGQPVSPTSTLVPRDGWVELASKVRFPDDVVAGTWRLRDNGLDSLDEALPGSPPRLLLPLIPSGGYEFEFTVTRLTGDGTITAHLPVGAGECVLQLHHTWPGHSERLAGLQFLNGQRVFSDQNPTRTVIEIENNRAYKLNLRVELLDDQAARVQVRLDDKPLIDWTGPQTSLGADPRWRRDPLGIGTSDATAARFENLRVRMLSGEAKLLR